MLGNQFVSGSRYDLLGSSQTRDLDGNQGVSSIEAHVYSGFADLETPWRLLVSRNERSAFYQSFDWCSCWMRACEQAGKPERARIVTVWEDGRLVLIWPLALARLGPIGILHALAEPATQYCDLLVQPSADASRWHEKAWVAARSIAGADVLHLRHVREDSALQLMVRERAIWRRIAAEDAPYVALTDHAESDASGRRRRSGRSLNALRRHWKHLERHGTVSVETVCPCAQVAAVAEAFDLKERWLRERGAASAGYQHPGNRQAVMSLAQMKQFSVYRLRVGGETAAVEVGLLDRGQYYSMIQSYDFRFAAHAPGRLLLWQLLEGHHPGIQTFDFLPPALPHKSEWTDVSVGVSDYVAPLSLKGRLAVSYLETYRQYLSRAFGALPPLVRRRVAGVATRIY